MDNFEALIRLLLEEEGYWTRQSHKVCLPKTVKKRLGKPSMPRPEIDLLAFKPATNTVILMEVKSYLDSPGVKLASLESNFETPTGRYKLFTCEQYSNAVVDQLRIELTEKGLANEKTTFKLGLAAGNIYKNQDKEMINLFLRRGWELWTPDAIWTRTKKLSSLGYANDPFVLAAKVLVRGNQRNNGDRA